MATHREIRQRKSEMAEAYSAGEHFDSICSRFGVEIAYLLNCLDSKSRTELKAELKRNSRSEKEVRQSTQNQDVLRLYDLGMSFEGISGSLDMKVSKIRKIVNDHNASTAALVRLEESKREVSEITELIQNGMTLREVGSIKGVSGERIRQILVRNNVQIRDLRRQAGQVKEVLKIQIRNWIVEHPGCFIEEISREFGLDDAEIESSIDYKSERFIVRENIGEKSSNNRKFTNEASLEALKTAFNMRNPMSSLYAVESKRPLTGPYYEKMRKAGLINGPSQMRILQVFGTWRKACDLAGVESVEPVRDSYDLRWTREQLVTFLAEFLIESEAHSIDAFDEWCRQTEERPSGGTIRNQVGPWSTAKREALIELRQSWVK
jgi:hypothetical protein